MGQLLDDRFDLQRIRILRCGRIRSPITYGPSRAISDSRRRTHQLIIRGRRGGEYIFRWMTALSLTAFLRHTREPAGEYEITLLKGIPVAREADSLRRRRGRYRRRRVNVLQEIQQQNPYGRPPAWKELHGEVKTLRRQSKYDSDQEGAKHQATIRNRKYAAYEKRQEARRQERK